MTSAPEVAPAAMRRRTLMKGAAWTVPVLAVASTAPAFAVSCTQLPSLAMPTDWQGPAVAGQLKPATGDYANGYKTYTPRTSPVRDPNSVTRYWSWQDDTAKVAGPSTITLTRTIDGLNVGQRYTITYSTQMGAGQPDPNLGGQRYRQWVDVSIGDRVDRFSSNGTLPSPAPSGYDVLAATSSYPIYPRTITFVASATSMDLTVQFTLPATGNTRNDGDGQDDIGVGGFSIACAP